MKVGMENRLSEQYRQHYIQNVKNFDPLKWESIIHCKNNTSIFDIKDKLNDIFEILTEFDVIPCDASLVEVCLSKDKNILIITYIYNDHVIYCDYLKIDTINIPIDWLDIPDNELEEVIKEKFLNEKEFN